MIMINPIKPKIGARISGVDLSRDLDPDTVAILSKAWDDYGVLVFHDQHLTDEQHIRFSRCFGDLDEYPASLQARSSTHPEIFRVSNVDEKGAILPKDSQAAKLVDNTDQWHTDGSWSRKASLGSVLRALEIEPGSGGTLFCSTTAAYRDLPESLRSRIDGRTAVHSFLYMTRLFDLAIGPEDREKYPPQHHPLAITLPSGRRSLYLAIPFIERLEGMPEEEGRGLVRELVEFATQPERTYTHEWTPGDVVMWNNLATMHRKGQHDGSRVRRVLHRTTVQWPHPLH